METNQAKLVPFWPVKRREIHVGDLAKKIASRQKSHAITAQDIYEKRATNKIMLRLYHIGYGTSKAYSLPVSINAYVNKNGLATVWRGSRGNVEVDALNAYRNVQKFLFQDGFNCEVKLTKGKNRSSLYNLTLIVNDTMEEN